MSSVLTSNTYCAYMASGTSFTKSLSTAVTWSNGAKLGSAIGIDLSSRTGFATDAKLTYSFSATRKLCGTNGYPGGSGATAPRRLYAKL